MKIDNEFKALIPPLTADEFKVLEANIVKEGCRDALILWNDTLIDGHNRYEICTKHNIPFKTVEKEFADRKDVIEWIILNQFGRRNLPAYERARLALKLKPTLAEKAKERMLNPMHNSAQGTTRSKLAEVAGVSHNTIARVETIEKNASEELKKELRSGDISINQAYQAVRRQEKKKAVQQRIDEHKAVQTGVIDLTATDRKYNIVYADPPWKYWESGDRNQSMHYTTMTVDEICDLPVKNIAADDSILFLWVTYPILDQAFKVIEAWGYKYSTCAFVWVKKNKTGNGNFFGLGSWTRSNSELCLLATKGNIMRLDASISQVIESPIEEHSKKPDMVRNLITQLVGELPRVELFCRNPADGWDVWGNEA